jgi:hypothetical protein
MDDSMNCNICGTNEFADMKNRVAVRCRACNSLERTRLLWLYIEKYAGLHSGMRVLHIAPELGLYQRISNIVAPANYHAADLFPELYKFPNALRRIDLCDLEGVEPDYYDLIIHSHVLEHVTCNIGYTLFHLHRMLKPAGMHICVIPFMSGKYDECFQDLAPEERVRRFGQADHVRRFGIDDVDQHLGKLLNFSTNFDAELEFGAEMLTRYNIPKVVWRGLSPHTVLRLGKHDMKMMPA